MTEHILVAYIGYSVYVKFMKQHYMLIVFGVSLVIPLYLFYLKKKVVLHLLDFSIGITINTFRGFFAAIDWWVYLLTVGLVLRVASSASEYFIKKAKKLRENWAVLCAKVLTFLLNCVNI